MSAQRLAIFFVLVLILFCSAAAQDFSGLWLVNQLSATAGRTFVSTQTIENDSSSLDPRIHFGNPASFEFNYARRLKTRGIFGVFAELPVAIYPKMDLNTYQNQIPHDIGALFVTPSARVNIFYRDSVSPWVSVGGGYGRFRESSQLNFYNPNPGSTGTNTGVIQFGAGLDVWFWSKWGARFEARDFYSGLPDYDVTTNASRQHNFYVGAGVMHRF
ncbi:MAG: outer membrane beta-barrel protein [Terriglobales bacterium]